MFGIVAENLRRLTVLVRDGGSGVLWRPDLIVTNAHVARRDRHVVDLWDGRRLDAAVIRRDLRRDLALLKIQAPDAPAARAGDSAALRPGQIVVAVGNPLGFIGALSTGVVHAQDRRWVQADIRLAPGNSGGPLADAEGRVVGINTMVAGRLAFAVPSNAVTAFIESVAKGAQPGPALGVVLRPVRTGLLILEVEPASPAAQASLLQGDVLVGFDSPDELHDAIESSEILYLKFLRGDRRVREVAVRLRAAAA
jgi:serine protease Do